MKSVLLVMLPSVLIPAVLVFIWATVQRRKHPPSKEALESAALLLDRRWLSSGLAPVTFTGVHEGAYSVRKLALLHGMLKIALLTVPVLAFAWFMYTFTRELRKGDEFARRVQLEALSFAFPAILFWMMGMWLMDEIWPTPHHGTFSGALVFLPLMYCVGLFAAKGRYLPTHKDRP